MRWTPRAEQQVEGALDGLRCPRRAPTGVARPVGGLRRVDVAGADPEVVGDVDVHRPGTSVAREFERLGDDLGQVLDAVGLVAALRDRLDDAREVGREVAVLLLQRAAVELVGRHLAGDGHERRRVGEGVAHRDCEEHGARTRRRIDRDRNPGRAEVGVGHEPGRRLHPRPHELDLVLAVVDAVEQTDRTVTRVAEDVRRLLADEVVDHEVGPAHLCH
jgi:hypothetical protein